MNTYLNIISSHYYAQLSSRNFISYLIEHLCRFLSEIYQIQTKCFHWHNKQQSQVKSDQCKILTNGVPISSNQPIFGIPCQTKLMQILNSEDSTCTTRVLLFFLIQVFWALSEKIHNTFLVGNLNLFSDL